MPLSPNLRKKFETEVDSLGLTKYDIVPSLEHILCIQLYDLDVLSLKN